ncbi:MAG TPA: DUF3445 domain-containing protein [Acetobacteraceae bacterium]|jgi:hypothetical protein|nr:DUF3445 domain-containing protein [Acetobacteraceae bacterium]
MTPSTASAARPCLRLPPETLHLPFEAGPFRMAMALVAQDPSELIELDDRYPAEAAERRALLEARHADVFAACPGSEAARAQVLDRLAEFLPARFPALFERENATLRNRITGEDWNLADPPHDPLEIAGRLVQEDLCIIRPDPRGPVLDAAVLCFPSRWRLADKIGRPLAAVHGPVPLYADRLAAPVDRFMTHLRPGKLAVRLNWSVMDDAALFQPGGKFRMTPNEAVTASNAGETTWLRVERQSLSRLPCGSVLFGIRVHVYPLSTLAGLPQEAARLAHAIRSLPPEIATYKSLAAVRDPLLGWLDAQSAPIA